jgi:hypothetical protein
VPFHSKEQQEMYPGEKLPIPCFHFAEKLEELTVGPIPFDCSSQQTKRHPTQARISQIFAVCPLTGTGEYPDYQYVGTPS